MKKSISALLLSSCILAFTYGCNLQESQSKETKAEAATNTDYLKSYQANPQVTDDRNLLKIGDETTDERGYAKLENLNLSHKSYKIDDITLTIRDVKQIYLEPDYSMIDYFHVLTHDEKFDIIKTFVEVTNNSDHIIHFSPVAILTADDGKKWTWDQDVYLDNLSGEIKPHETKRGNIGFILKNDTTPKKFVLQTSDVFDKNEQKLSDGEKISLTFSK